MRKVAVYLWAFVVLFWIYTAISEIYIDSYHHKVDALRQRFDRLDWHQPDYKEKADCLIKEMDRHLNGYDDIVLWNPASWVRADRMEFGKGCR